MGPPEPKHPLIVDERHYLRVTRNLFNAVLSLRRQNEQRIIWIDAIGINQHDLEERNSQVSIMGDIYSLAKGVCACIGMSSHSSELSFDVLDDFESYQQILRRETDKCVDFALSKYKSRVQAFKERSEQEQKSLPERDEDSDPAISCGVDLLRYKSKYPRIASLIDGGRMQYRLEGDEDPSFNEFGKAFADLFNHTRTYWFRIWIVQELLLAKSVLIFCGNRWTSFQTLCLLVKRWEHAYRVLYRDLTSDPYLGVSAVMNILKHRAQFSVSTPDMSLSNIIYNYASRNLCTDPKDRVYGFRSLCTDLQTLSVDYSKDTFELFADIMRLDLLNKPGGLRRAARLFARMGLGDMLPDDSKIQSNETFRWDLHACYPITKHEIQQYGYMENEDRRLQFRVTYSNTPSQKLLSTRLGHQLRWIPEYYAIGNFEAVQPGDFVCCPDHEDDEDGWDGYRAGAVVLRKHSSDDVEILIWAMRLVEEWEPEEDMLPWKNGDLKAEVSDSTPVTMVLCLNWKQLIRLFHGYMKL